jgi:hypothetical protein
MAPRSGHLRPADGLLAPSVAKTISQLRLEPQDGACALLARQYAEAIDNAPDRGKALELHGHRLLAVLEALGATPRARAAAAKGVTPGAGRLAALRAARSS